MKLYCNPELTKPGEPALVPAWLENARCAWMEAVCLKFEFGYVLAQSSTHDQYSMHIIRFVITSPHDLYVQLDQSAVALQFTTIGRITGEMRGLNKVVLEPHHYSLFYIPSQPFKLSFEQGTYESIHFELHPLLIDELAGNHRDISQLMEVFFASSTIGLRLFPVQMDGAVYRLMTNLRNCRATEDDLEGRQVNTIGTLLYCYKNALDAPQYAHELSASVYHEEIEHIRQEIVAGPDARKHTLAWFAKRYNMSESTLKRVFKALVGVTLPGFVMRQCMLKAGSLLKERKLTIDDVADELGYSDRSGFSRAFKRMYSKTPGEFRTMWWRVG